MEGSPRPRRALDPLPEDWSAPPQSAADTPAGPLFDEPDELTDTGMMRRLALNPDGTLKDLAPPPRPVLPTSEALPASAGRRFSADDVPFEREWVAPRRSAVSVPSPPSPYEQLLPPVSRPTQPPEITLPYQPVSAQLSDVASNSFASAASGESPTPSPSAAEPQLTRAERKAASEEAKADAKRAAQEAKADARAAKADAKAEAKAAKLAAKEAKKHKDVPVGTSRPDIVARLGEPQVASNAGPVPPPSSPSSANRAAPAAPKSARSVRPAVLVIAAVVAVALLVTAGVWIAFRPSASTGAAGTDAVDQLLTANEVTALGAGPWQKSPAGGSVICLSGGVGVKSDRTVSGGYTGGNGNSILQTVDSYPNEKAATDAYNERLSKVGNCVDGAALVNGAYTVDGLANTAGALALKANSTAGQAHTVLVARTGRTVNTFDVVTKAAVPVTTVADVAAKPLSRQCTEGNCPGAIAVKATLPAPGIPAGWLEPSDLPLLTPGVGKWTAADLKVNTPGTSCEGMPLDKVAGTTSAGMRTLLLVDDPKAAASATSAGFGVDQVNYVFPNAKAAQSLATTLTRNLSACGTLKLGATVDRSATVRGVGANSTTITGQTWRITRDLGGSKIPYRVAVLSSGNRVTYLFSNPTKTADFSDDDWQAIALRAGQRASQG